MTEQEAIDIACRFADERRIKHQGVERAFFVPVSSYDYVPPGMKDEWVVHFRPLPVGEEEFDKLLSSDCTIIVAVDAESKQPSLMSVL
jgi:hypothetical protein